MTRLERWIAPRVVANAGLSPGEERSAFRLLSTGIDAFVARAVLIELAESTLDLQYYIFHPDRTGSLIIERLIAAADRGVKVRAARRLGHARQEGRIRRRAGRPSEHRRQAVQSLHPPLGT